MDKRQRTILIVDDSPEDRAAYRRYLSEDRNYTYRIIEEESGERGLERCQQLLPDGVLLDFRLPDLDGLEFLSELQQLHLSHQPPIILLTGYGNEAIAVRAMKAGVQDYLIKGEMNSEMLRLSLNSVIENAQLRQQLQQSQLELLERETRFRQIANEMPQIVWVAIATGELDFINDRWFDYTGLPRQKENHPCPLISRIHEQDLEAMQQTWQSSLRNGTLFEAEFRLCGADGGYHWFLSRAFPVRDQLNQIHHWYGTSTDITELKQLQLEREILLEREQLARAEAEAANRAKDDFIATVAHELRSPLNAIIGWTQLLRSGRIDPSLTNKALEAIARGAKSQAHLIDDLLDTSRIIQGKLSLERLPVEPIAVVRSAIDMVRPAAAAKAISLNANLDASTGPVLADFSRLQQVVWNLLSNAVKFTPEGGRVEVRLERQENQGRGQKQLERQEDQGRGQKQLERQQATGNRQQEKNLENNSDLQNSASISYVQITVSDTGKGISPEFLPFVFDRFRQANHPHLEGLGLGLAIVKQLVELHGGNVTATSPGEGQGASFIVTLPLIN